MRTFESDESWVIYQTVSRGVVSGPNAVCEQAEWDEMERLRPGAQSVVQFGIATEGLAERLARGYLGRPLAAAHAGDGEVIETPSPPPAGVE